MRYINPILPIQSRSFSAPNGISHSLRDVGQTFTDLYQQYHPALKKKICRLLGDRYKIYGEDLLQETFYKIFLYRNNYDPAKGMPFTWMANIAQHATIGFLRSKYAKTISQERRTYPPNRISCMSCYRDFPVYPDISIMLASLNKQEVKIIQLKYYYGFTGSDLAAALNIPIGTYGKDKNTQHTFETSEVRCTFHNRKVRSYEARPFLRKGFSVFRVPAQKRSIIV
ncbi:RNA polymerase sigma factor [Chitinophaga cymbidii]|uniref:RNA polymerase sigma factor n=1 Tax=Chitinophaga cymbidii TaxID=1096750 RepID=UPI0011BFC609